MNLTTTSPTTTTHRRRRKPPTPTSPHLHNDPLLPFTNHLTLSRPKRCTFPQFPLFPPELKKIILLYALPSTRTIAILDREILTSTPTQWTRYYFPNERYNTQFKTLESAVHYQVPALLQVCQSFRSILKKEFPLEFSRLLKYPVYFRFERDCLYFHTERAARIFYGSILRISRIPIPLSRGLDIARLEENLRFLMIGQPCLFKHTTELITRCRNLEVLRLKEGCFTLEQKIWILTMRWNERWGSGDEKDKEVPIQVVQLGEWDMQFWIKDSMDGYSTGIQPRHSPRIKELVSQPVIDHACRWELS